MELIRKNTQILDTIIMYLLFPLLIMDMVNGILYTNDFLYLVSVSQVYKLVLVLFFLVRLSVVPKVLFRITIATALLLIPSVIQIFYKGIGVGVLFSDLISTSKYLIIILSYYFFRVYLNDSNNTYTLLNWIKFSYWVLAINLLGKLVGIGYPMYSTGNIGTRGFFIAGNEISALLLVLSSIIGYYYYVIKKDKIWFIFYLFLSFVLGLLISSKTGMLGVVLIHGLIIISEFDFSKKISRTTLIKTVSSIGIVLSAIVLFVLNTSIFGRYVVFWRKLDFMTFMLSSRNIYIKEAIEITSNNYQWFDYIIGAGPTMYIEMTSKYVEIDFIDIFFSYGIIGVIVFLGFYGIRLKEAIVNKRSEGYTYAKLTTIVLMMLLLLSCLSGHILNSGIAGVFIGFLISLAYKKD